MFLFWFGVLMLERPFGILTRSSLLELSAFDRPLLQQLCAVAPGTYAHSMLVGTLAESGAQAIGADALLCRVGGYYHDIGKMKRPDFFVENQRRGNVHGRLSPSLSALIITAHVRDGVEMSQDQKLPKEIRDIIGQHHGTTLIRYFYHQALADCESLQEVPDGLEERFRYPGPKPQTREAAIVMLADSVEAAARSIDKPSQERLEALIEGIVRDKIDDKQLEESPLTFRDVQKISEAFLHVLTAMMHGRIEYPKEMPRTATGQPMEVLRSDLRPEFPPQNIPLNFASSENNHEENAVVRSEIPLEIGAKEIGLEELEISEMSDPVRTAALLERVEALMFSNAMQMERGEMERGEMITTEFEEKNNGTIHTESTATSNSNSSDESATAVSASSSRKRGFGKRRR